MSSEEREAIVRLLRDVLDATEWEIEYLLAELGRPGEHQREQGSDDSN